MRFNISSLKNYAIMNVFLHNAIILIWLNYKRNFPMVVLWCKLTQQGDLVSDKNAEWHFCDSINFI